MSKPKYHVASFSGGKDSTAMVLHMIERGEHINEVICCDTYKEFPAMYRHIEKVKQVIEEAGVKFTLLKSGKSFDYLMFEEITAKDTPGRAWPNFKTRWCTGELKKDIINKYLKPLKEQYNVIQSVGLAADEGHRLNKAINKLEHKRHPLIEWGWDERTCLEYCYSKGYDWEGLYEIFDRVSCWCCPLKSLVELRSLRKHFPDLWEELKNMDKRAWNQFRADYSVEDLDKRFDLEDALTEAGHSLKNRVFFADLKRLLAEEVTVEKILNERRHQT
jgi:3'-phosphoadenosine 5'-phosphosulfate sulfotransferase (PAPS reductase)/FAD synthetase